MDGENLLPYSASVQGGLIHFLSNKKEQPRNPVHIVPSQCLCGSAHFCSPYRPRTTPYHPVPNPIRLRIADSEMVLRLTGPLAITSSEN